MKVHPRLLILLIPLVASVPAVAAPTGPESIVKRYYAWIDDGKLHRAFALWDKAANRRQTYDAFAAGFAGTRHTPVKTGKPRNEEGAAGSSFIDVPVTITALQKNGTVRRYAGTYTLRAGNAGISGNEKAGEWRLWSSNIRKL